MTLFLSSALVIIKQKLYLTEVLDVDISVIFLQLLVSKLGKPQYADLSSSMRIYDFLRIVQSVKSRNRH